MRCCHTLDPLKKACHVHTVKGITSKIMVTVTVTMQYSYYIYIYIVLSHIILIKVFYYTSF